MITTVTVIIEVTIVTVITTVSVVTMVTIVAQVTILIQYLNSSDFPAVFPPWQIVLCHNKGSVHI